MQAERFLNDLLEAQEQSLLYDFDSVLSINRKEDGTDLLWEIFCFPEDREKEQALRIKKASRKSRFCKGLYIFQEASKKTQLKICFKARMESPSDRRLLLFSNKKKKGDFYEIDLFVLPGKKYAIVSK